MADDYYEVLGVVRECTSQDVKRAFRAIAKACHPDVAGDDPIKEARFRAAKEAYEVLGDDAARARYDRKRERKAQRRAGGGSFREAFYRRTAERHEGQARPTSGRVNRRSSRRVNDPGNNLDLDDLFNDFGFGRKTESSRTTSTGAGQTRDRRARPRAPMPKNGHDVQIDLDVPAGIARDGGTVTAVYYRMQRADSWRPGSSDSGIVRVQDIADIRLVPGTRDGQVLHERGCGDAGAHGGPFGDLVVRVRVVADRRSKKRASSTPDEQAPPPQEQAPPPQDKPPVESGAAQPQTNERAVKISVAEAVLGTRVELTTPQGRVRLTVPAGTSSGSRMRLRGKGGDGANGEPGDLYVTLQIVVPKELDDESRQIMLRFGMLNPAPSRE